MEIRLLLIIGFICAAAGVTVGAAATAIVLHGSPPETSSYDDADRWDPPARVGELVHLARNHAAWSPEADALTAKMTRQDLPYIARVLWSVPPHKDEGVSMAVVFCLQRIKDRRAPELLADFFVSYYRPQGFRRGPVWSDLHDYLEALSGSSPDGDLFSFYSGLHRESQFWRWDETRNRFMPGRSVVDWDSAK